eukprot:TRINITY_DN4827_c0_g1_i1.p1 TRINITY_DN4827_c0_g1~~TRINITY_DN4827_c0_g1_i1.p1  ORF type:complete len:479 (+),score=85.68 TRINITY_DN4827_c0_g1_i1:104-1540(+)
MTSTTLEDVQLLAISPVDGRYWRSTKVLSDYFSEYSLIRYRTRVEVEYFIALCDAPLPELRTVYEEAGGKDVVQKALRGIYVNFTTDDAKKVKSIERTTNHDVKAIEYFLKERFASSSFLGACLVRYEEFLHFGLTSQDINHTALPLSIKDAIHQVYLPTLEECVMEPLLKMGQDMIEIPMLARTHGQPATPTRVGKELLVFHERLSVQLRHLKAIPFTAKFGGATGCFNAHVVAYSSVDWPSFADSFLASDGMGNLKRQQFTTQIEHFDELAALFHQLSRINVILIDMCRDLWQYISMEYFKQMVVQGEVGSSTMPHKVNPIDFENAEGNCGLANALFIHLGAKLPISRLQRDLTDSTVTRNIGVPVSHSLIAFRSVARGLSKLILNKQKLGADLDNNWAVVGEAIQSILRRERFPKPYEALKDLTRGKGGGDITQADIATFVDNLPSDLVSQSVRDELKRISPSNYIGVVPAVRHA